MRAEGVELGVYTLGFRFTWDVDFGFRMRGFKITGFRAGKPTKPESCPQNPSKAFLAFWGTFG